MSTERDNGITRFTCDSRGCRANYESDEGDFTAAWSEAKAHGWVAAVERGVVWKHYCPTCKRELGDD